jgi:hypothetical protein
MPAQVDAVLGMGFRKMLAAMGGKALVAIGPRLLKSLQMRLSPSSAP